MNKGDEVFYTFLDPHDTLVEVQATVIDIYTIDGSTQISVAWFDVADNYCIEHWIPINSKNISYANNQKTD